MRLTTRTIFLAALLSVPVSGCMENIALIGRPTIPEGREDVVGEIQRVEMPARRIYLRAKEGGEKLVVFSPDAKVLDRGREYPVSRLEPGDQVAIQMKENSRGDLYADLIRIQESAGAPGRDTLSTAEPQIQTLSGKVERVDVRRNSFDLDDQPGKPILVVLSENARDSDREHLRDLRPGDRVRIEGRFSGRERFELLSFLNDEPLR